MIGAHYANKVIVLVGHAHARIYNNDEIEDIFLVLSHLTHHMVSSTDAISMLFWVSVVRRLMAG